MSEQPALLLSEVGFSYGEKTILENFNLNIPPGRIYSFIGSSGSGKTTALRLMNGLLTAQHGDVILQGQRFTPSEGEKWRRKMGYVIQGSGLFPHMNLEENLCIIARREGWTPAQMKKRIHELCELMGLSSQASFLKQKPRAISGGQQQRVGIARALFMKPQILLMDEPFSALDPITRSELQTELVTLQKKLQLTIVLVTHDLSEAFSLSDQMVLLNQGRVEQVGRPSQFLTSPSTDYVRKFIQSHSPGALLKKIYLYSVMNTQVWVLNPEHESSPHLMNLENGEQKSFESFEELQKFLKSQGQDCLYRVDSDQRLLGWGPIGSKATETQSLASTHHILDAMKSLLEQRKSLLPVVNEQAQLMGVFSEEALHAL